MSSGAASPVFDLEWMTLTSVCLLIDNPESISGTIRLSLLSISEDFFFKYKFGFLFVTTKSMPLSSLFSLLSDVRL